MSFQYKKDEQNLAILTMNTPNLLSNIINRDFFESLQAVVEKVQQDDVRGVIITSAKKTFVEGADIEMLYELENPKEAFEMTEILKGLTRKLETLGKPVVAAINGECIGGGLELALCCHHRICINNSKIKIGLPEVTLGLLPGGGE